jgi:hypothetical protein
MDVEESILMEVDAGVGGEGVEGVGGLAGIVGGGALPVVWCGGV